MKKLLSLVLAAGMLAGLCAPVGYAQPAAQPAAVVGEVAANENAAPALAGDVTARSRAAAATFSEEGTTEPALSFHVTTDDGIDFTSADPFADMSLVVGKEYTFELLLDGEPLEQAGYKLTYVQIPPTGQDKLYLKVVSTDTEKGSFVLTPTEATSSEMFLGSLSMTMTTPDNQTIYPYFTCIGTTVADTGRALFVNQTTGAPVTVLEASAGQKQFTLSLAGAALDAEKMTIEYGTSVPGSVTYSTEEQDFGSVKVTVNRALSSDASFYANVKDKTTGAVLTSAVVTLKWYTPISADTLPGGDKIYFGAKSNSFYSSWYSAEYNQADTTQTGTLQVFFGKTREDGYTVDYTDQPLRDTVSSIAVTSLNEDVVTVTGQTPASEGIPFTFQYAVKLDTCATAQLQATVTLEGGATYTALFTIDVVENLAAQDLTVKNAEELTAALANVALTPGSIITLEPGTYAGNFTVTTPVTLIASEYNGAADLYNKETGEPVADANATVIEGTITAVTQNVAVYGLRFQCPADTTGLTALTDVNAVSGCVFTGYDTAVALSKTIHSNSNYRVVKNVFTGNTTALRFAGREWLSNVQDNSFLDNTTALVLDAAAYVDGPNSKVYNTKVNGGKWTNNFFRGTSGQQVLADDRTNKDATLLLNYNYYLYNGTMGAVVGLFADGAKADYSVFYTSPALTSVSTNADLSTLTGGLNLVAQQQDAAADSALNVSGTLFDTLKGDDADGLTLKVWTTDEELAAVWSFPKDKLTATTDANLGVDETLSAGETEVVESELPEGVTAQTVSFAHSGDLPGTATVQVPLPQQLDTNEELGLYYIDEETGKLELQDTEVTVTADGNLQFDIEHCSSYLVAAKSAMDEPPAAPDAPEASVVTVNYGAETLAYDSQYEVNTKADFTGTALATGASLSDLLSDKAGTLYVRIKAQGDTPASAATPVTLPARPAAPTGVAAAPTRYADTQDGSLTGVTTAMEYKAAEPAGWTACTGATVTGLAAGTYQVRLAATATAFAGMPAELTVQSGPERVYSISVQAPVFEDLTYGEEPAAAQPLVLTNNGNCDAELVSIAVDNAAFTLQEGSETTVPAGGALQSYTLQPAGNLDTGTYTATVTVTYQAGSEQKTATAQVKLQVNRRPLSITPVLKPSNQVEVGDSMPLLDSLTITGLVSGDSLAPDTAAVQGLPENTDTAGRWDIRLDEATQNKILALDVAQNYEITFHTLSFQVLEKDSVLEETDIAGTDYRVVQDEVRGVPDTSFDSEEEVKTELLRVLNTRLDGATEENTLMQDITLYVSADNGTTWTEATGENFPQGGITVKVPYPAGLENPETYTFTVVHMCHDGSTEQPAVTMQAAGIQFTLTSFSPVAVSWAPAKPQPVVSESAGSSAAASATPAPTAAPADGIVYYTCPACGHHDWTATDAGYRCDACGYLESVKQLSGYGNVRGIYEPRSSGAQNSGQHQVSGIPTTGDESHPMVWVVLLAAAALGLGSLISYKRKDK